MIVLDLELKGIYGFNDFHINFSYPKTLTPAGHCRSCTSAQRAAPSETPASKKLPHTIFLIVVCNSFSV